MLQLCFGDSVKGSLTCAPHMSNTVGGVTAVVLSSAKPLETPLQKAAFAVYRTLAALGKRGPYEMGALLKYERSLPAAARHALVARWRTLQAENAPLRAVVDGQLCSVPADFYDTAILSKVPAGNFLTAQLIGKVLSECNLGISDQLIYRRIERLVKAGKLTQVTQGSGPYENILRLP